MQIIHAGDKLDTLDVTKCYAINKDCLEAMHYIPNKSMDMILCDLPYGTTQNKWDSVIPLAPIWYHYERIIKDNGAIVLFAQTPFDKQLGASNLALMKYEWVWRKNNTTGHLNAKKAPMKEHENILVFYKKPPIYNPQGLIELDKPVNFRRGKTSTNYGTQTDYVQKATNYPKSILNFGLDKGGFHPTQKPVDLLEYLILTYTNRGGHIMDNCAGSFSTAIACDNTERNFICIEKDPEYFAKGIDRIELNRIML